MNYPSPAYAAHIWYADGKLRIGLPAEGDARGHTIDIPCDEKGMHLLVRLMAHRAAHARGKIGTPYSPTQYDLDRVRAMSDALTRRVGRVKKVEDISLEELGL